MTAAATQDGRGGDSYYGRPILKEPVWKPTIPWYFFTGGLAGASSVLSYAARRGGNVRLARTSLGIAFAAEVASPGLLISDLGRPERFLNMLRVFKPTSPMSVGSWVLAVSGASTTASVATRALGVLPRLQRMSGTVSAGAGGPLAVYTATLLSDTAIPVWHEGRRELPFVFAADSAASAGAAATLLLSPDDAAPARRLAICGALAAEGLAEAMRSRLGLAGEVYGKGKAGRFDRLAKAASLTGAALLFAGGRGRASAMAGSALVLGGGLARRFSVFHAGFQSARDPRYTVDPQRARADDARA
ncbi:MAG TPA: NrfD/PsrC family molybdoenzyme membrane anchor subunit [Gaiellaceae bacterium]